MKINTGIFSTSVSPENNHSEYLGVFSHRLLSVPVCVCARVCLILYKQIRLCMMCTDLLYSRNRLS